MYAFYALSAALVNSGFILACRYLVARGGMDAIVASLLMQVLSGGIALVGLLATHAVWQPAGTLPLTIAVLAGFVGFVLAMLSFAREDASAVTPLIGLKVLLLVFLEAALDGHGVRGGLLLGSVLSVGGVLLVTQTDRWSLRPRDLLRPGVVLMLAVAVCYAISDLAVKYTLFAWHGSSWQVSLYVLAGSALPALLGLAVWRGERTAPPQDTSARFRVSEILLLGSVLNVIVPYLLFTAFAISGSVTLSNILFNTRSLFVVLLAMLLVLGHCSTLEHAGPRAYLYRTCGALLTIAAIVLAMR